MFNAFYQYTGFAVKHQIVKSIGDVFVSSFRRENIFKPVSVEYEIFYFFIEKLYPFIAIVSGDDNFLRNNIVQQRNIFIQGAIIKYRANLHLVSFKKRMSLYVHRIVNKFFAGI